MKKFALFAALAASTLALAAPASAEPVRSRLSVSTAGLDLNTAQGVRALDLRILHAASALCGTPSPADARGRAKYDDCRDQARTTAALQRDQILAAARGEVRLADAR
jgi:UrcA family protein